MSYDAVIFDKDGVLIDSMADNYRWADKIRKREYSKEGREVDIEKARRLVKLRTVTDLENFMDAMEIDIETVRETERKILQEKIRKIRKGDIQLFESVRKVLQDVNLPKSVVSNAPQEATHFTLEYFDIDHYFEHVRSPELADLHEYVEIKKPSPRMLLEVKEKMGAENPLMVGDSTDDIQAARNAGIDSCLVNQWEEAEIKPDYRLEDLEELPALLNR